jgi:predicted CoA-binding protein
MTSYGGLVADADAIVERILTTYGTITVVGASAAPAKGSTLCASAYAAARMAHHPGQPAR